VMKVCSGDPVSDFMHRIPNAALYRIVDSTDP
jgi:hypothetical protein